MIATFKFKLPEEAIEHNDALNGTAYRIALENMDNSLRNRIKYEDDLEENVREALQSVRDSLLEYIREIKENA